MNYNLKKQFIQQSVLALMILLLSTFCFLCKYYVISYVIIFFVVIPLSKILSLNKIKKSNKEFNTYTIEEPTGCFRETSPIYYSGLHKEERGVLLIHGFSASPNELSALSDGLKQKGITHYAPLLTGFGLTNYHLLEKIDGTDWIRDIFQAYELLASQVNRVDVVGHSMGGMLSLFLAQYKDINTLVLSSPYLIPRKNNAIHKKLLTAPVLQEFILWLKPFFSKKSGMGKNDINTKRFAYNILPLNAVKVLWELQDRVNYGLLKEKSITIFFGEEDRTVELKETVEFLNRKNITFEYKMYEDIGHNLLESEKQKEVVNDIFDALGY